MSKHETTTSSVARFADGVTQPSRGRQSPLPLEIVRSLAVGQTVEVTAARKGLADRKPEQPRALAAWRVLAPEAQQLLREIEERDRYQETLTRDLVRNQRDRQLRLAPEERSGTPGPPAGWRWIVLEEHGFHPATLLLDMLRGLEWLGLLELRDVSSLAGDSNGNTSAGGPQHDSGRPATRPAAVRLTWNGRQLVHLMIGMPDRRSSRPPGMLPGTLWRILLAVAEVERVGLPAGDVPHGLGRQLTTAESCLPKSGAGRRGPVALLPDRCRQGPHCGASRRLCTSIP
jgi:hypothetical protein